MKQRHFDRDSEVTEICGNTSHFRRFRLVSVRSDAAEKRARHKTGITYAAGDISFQVHCLSDHFGNIILQIRESKATDSYDASLNL